MTHRPMDFMSPIAAIRLARIYAAGPSGRDCSFTYDWSVPGQKYGKRRETTWAEKRIMVEAKYEDAAINVSIVRASSIQRERAELMHGTELAGLRQQKLDLQNKPLGVDIAPMLADLEDKIAAIIAAA